MLALFFTGCLSPEQVPEDIPVTTKIRTPVVTLTPEKEIVYVYVTVTVTPTAPTPLPTATKDPVAQAELATYTAWRYQYVSKDDGSFHYGPVTSLVNHLGKAPDTKKYELYYQGGRIWKDDLETRIETVKTSAPAFHSLGMRSAISNYTTFLTIQNGTIRTLNLVLTNWEFGEAEKVTNGIVINVTNATAALDREVAVLV